MSNLPDTVEVAVVGAGPVGLTAAVALAQFGIDAVVLDAAESRSVQSKAAVVHSRTLEALRELGVADRLVERGVRVPYFGVRDRDRGLVTVDFRPLPTDFPYTLMCPQDVTETVLDERLRELGGRVRRPLTLVGLRQGQDAVELEVADAEGQARRLSARYVVGADGAHSAVRGLLGVEFTGGTYDQGFYLADVRMDWALSREEVQLFFSPAGLAVVAPLPHGRHRIVATVDGPLHGTGVSDPQALLDQRGPRARPATVRELVWSSNFRVSHRIATHYRRGRVFLAGDAAHVHSPAGGQGMNTGIQDAANLAWKLALGCRGRADDALLDTYESERRPVAEGVVAQTHRLTTLATMRGPLRTTLRNAALRTLGRLPPVRRGLAFGLSGLAVNYGSGDGKPGAWAGITLPPVAGTPRYRLVLPGAVPEAEVARLRRAAGDRNVLVHRHERVSSAQLVRPDGYLAASTPTVRATELLDAVPH
ncbi:FAD-dependent monooxygenase [Pseudonocardia acaciae]|uniref:FAD-dependent monooxygenase n=1 Tax=Pseudonocardia acaciae TaxID=551276 RepID=UPI0007E8D09D|nr:FAD-dependent monooxygenase [Pseudonocardia acaciae]